MTGAASLDANVLARLTLKDVPAAFERAKSLVSRPDAQFQVSGLALTEYVFALDNHYGLTRDQITAMVRGVLSLPNVTSSCPFVDAVLEAWTAHPALSWADCYLAAAAEAAGLTPLWTFDKKLARQSTAASLVP